MNQEIILNWELAKKKTPLIIVKKHHMIETWHNKTINNNSWMKWKKARKFLSWEMKEKCWRVDKKFNVKI